ncbi:MAG: hypothetical protein JSR60_08420 [Proteobacteria bacterium]|nr:hypothetical protein [Pseudomonadota bacterium]
MATEMQAKSETQHSESNARQVLQRETWSRPGFFCRVAGEAETGVNSTTDGTATFS